MPAVQQLGEFQIASVLGQGGSGIVYVARWGHREVALKVLRDNLVATESERRRFFEEARSLSEIKHPSVVKVLSFGDLPDGRPYLAMELLPGQTLAQRIASGPLPVSGALDLFDQLVGAVEALHARGLVHRDLKPENIVLVTGDEYLVLLDFGIAKELSAQPSTVTQEGGIRGTPAYMAPERFFGQPASRRTDIYELAVTLYAMLVGRLPWDSAADPNDRLDPKRPSALGVALPGELESVLLRALSTRPEVRPESATALSQQVRAAANIPASHSPRSTVPVSSAETPPLQTPRQRPNGLGNASTVASTTRTTRRVWYGLAGALLLVAIVAAVAVALWSHGGSKIAAEDGDDSESTGASDDPSAAAEAAPEPDAAPARRQGDDSLFFEAASYHPSDTLILMGLRARELRYSGALDDLFNRAKESAYSRVANAYVGACDIDLFEDIDWITFGVSGKKRDLVELMVSGNWTRSRIDGCIGDLISGFGMGKPDKVVPDGDLTRLELGSESIFIGWVDDKTAMISLRDGADAAWMRGRLAKKKSVVQKGTLSPAIPKLDSKATFWLAGESDDDMAAEVLGKVAPPELIWMSLTVDDTVAMTGGAAFAGEKQAADAESAFGEWKKELIAEEPMYDMFLRIVKLKADGANLSIEAELDKSLTTLIAKTLESELSKSL